MLRFLPYTLKTLLRHRARTALTVSGTAVALFVFCFVGAVRDGLAGLTRDRRADRTLIVFQANRYCPSTSRMPETYARELAALPGVREVVPVKVFTNNCRASLDLIVFHGMPAEKLRSCRTPRLIEGDWEAFANRRDAALVGRAIATRRRLHPGQKFAIGQVQVTVAGVFASDNPAEENFIFSHLEFLQRTPGLNSVGTVTQFEVLLDDSADADALCRTIDERYRGGPVQTDTRTKGVFEANTVADLAELIGFAGYLGFACVGLVLALVATTTVMAVQDRVREFAVLQTIGFSGPRVFGLVITESLVLSAVGGAVGIVAAMVVLARGGLAVGTEGVSIVFRPSVGLAMTGLIVASVVGVVAGLVPAVRAARAEIVSSLRAV